MALDQQHFYPLVPTAEQSENLIRSGDWEMQVILQDLQAPPIDRVTSLEAYNSYIKSKITFDPANGPKIIEGYMSNDPLGDGNQGVVVMGNSLKLVDQGWSLIASTQLTDNSLIVSIIEQPRGTIDMKGWTAGVVRGFNEPHIDEADMAALEAFQETGFQHVDKFIRELGMPTNMMPTFMLSRLRGGANSFSIEFPSEILELIDVPRKRWHIRQGIFQTEAPQAEVEKVTASVFTDIMEVLSQRIWSGTVDGYSLISSARILTSKSNLDFSGYWQRLVSPKSLSQTHHNYPITPLTLDRYPELTGGTPTWQITLNNQLIVPRQMWFHNIRTGAEIVHGIKPEANIYDGFAIHTDEMVVMATVEINGQLYVGGQFGSVDHIAEPNIFHSPSSTINLENYSDQEAEKLFYENLGCTSAESDGTVLALAQSGGPINPNSAHFTGTLKTVFVQINPEKVIQITPDKYVIPNSNPNFVFVPIKEAIMNTSHGPTALAAAVLCGSAKIISLR
ncbi:MAG: hypothetical protein WAV41_05805 [Microgenomates group bacterium]